MMEEVGPTPIESLSKTVNAIGVKMDKKEINRRYFGRAPKGTYFGKPKDLKSMHDLSLSESRKRELYGIGQKKGVGSADELTTVRLATDSKADLISELCANSSMTKTEATLVVEKWMATNHLIEKQTVFGKAIVSEEGK